MEPSFPFLIAALPELLEHVASFLPPSYVAFCLRPVCKGAAAVLSAPDYKRARLSQPCPAFAFNARWGHESALAQLTQRQRVQLVGLVAASGETENMDRVLELVPDPGHKVVASAARAGQRAMFDHLLAAGFVVEDHMPLCVTAFEGQLDMCKHLVRTFPDTCQPDEITLGLAVRGGHLPVVQWLLQEAGCPWTLDAVREAADFGHIKLARWMLQQPRVSCVATAEAWGTAVTAAAKVCDFTTFQQLLEKPWPPGPQNTAIAARYSPTKPVWQEMVLAASDSFTPDWQAKIELLLEHPDSRMFIANPDAPEFWDFTFAARRADAVARLTWLHSAGLPLHHTLLPLCHDPKPNMEAVQLLLSHMVPPHGAGADNELNPSMAHRACATGCVELMSALHSAGCPFPRPALQRAAKGGHLPAVRWLRDHLPPPHCTLSADVVVAAAYSGDMALLEWLGLQEDVAVGPGAYTAAAAAGSVQAIRWLHGWGLAFPPTGMPYLAAARHGSVFALRALAAVGCPWGPPGRVFTRAVHSRWPVDVWVLEELLRLGCPVVWCGAVSAARRRGDPEVEAWVRVMHGEHQRAMAERRGGARAGEEAGVAAST